MKSKKLEKQKKNKKKEIFDFILLLILVFILIMMLINKTKLYNYLYNLGKEDYYYCDDGYVMKNSKCIKIIDSIDAIHNYFCDEGFDLDGTKCIRYEYDEVLVKWYCKSGYKMGKADYPDLCYKDIIEPYTLSYYCASGYSLSGSKCVSQKNSVYPSANNQVCPSGSNYIYALGVCVLSGVVTSCPGGYNVLERNGRYVTCFRYPSTVKSCPEGTTVNGTKCDYPTETIDAYSYKSCRTGAYYDKNLDKCVYTDYDVPNYKLYCNNGFEFHDNACYKIYTEDAQFTLSCEESYLLEDEKCVKYDITDAKKSDN